MNQNSKRKKILVIRFSSLGDVVLTTGIYPNIKAQWPDCEISVLTKGAFSALFDGNPCVDHVYYYDPKKQPFSQLTKEIRQEAFDIIIDLHSNIRSWFIRFISGAPITMPIQKMVWERRKLVWFKRTAPALQKSFRERVLECLEHLEVPVTHTETQLFPNRDPRFLDSLSLPESGTLIGMAPGARHKTKQWTPEGFAEVANRFGKKENTMILLLGGKEDQEVARDVSKRLVVPYHDLTGWTSIPELTALMAKLDVLLTNDSGLLHMGEALNIPVVTLFGPTVRGFGFAPYRPTSVVIEVNDLPCRPCTLHGDEKCPVRHHLCMKNIDVEAVYSAMQTLLDKKPTPVQN